MLSNDLTLDTKAFVKTTFSPAGTFYRSTDDDDHSLVVRWQRSKKCQNRINITAKVVDQFLLPSGSSADTTVTAGITIADFDVATDANRTKALNILLSAIANPTLIAQIRRGEQ